MAEATIDRERALVTARSVLANTDVLENEGLDSAGQARVVEIAEQLAAGLGGTSPIGNSSAAELASQLRELLAPMPGATAHTLVTWLDGVLDSEG